VKNRGSFSCSS